MKLQGKYVKKNKKNFGNNRYPNGHNIHILYTHC